MRVGGASRHADFARQTRYRHDQSARRLQMRQGMMRAPQAAEKIDAPHVFVPAEVGYVFEQRMAGHTGVVDEHIKRAKVRNRLFNEPLAIDLDTNSVATTSVAAPAASHRAATRSSASRRRAASTRRGLCVASCKASSAPMPSNAPVMTMTLFSKCGFKFEIRSSDDRGECFRATIVSTKRAMRSLRLVKTLGLMRMGALPAVR